jgi:hypothetical protein
MGQAQSAVTHHDGLHAFDAAEAAYGGVAVMVNNAGPDGGWINGQVLRANGGII